jgi:hypothetical protein
LVSGVSNRAGTDKLVALLGPETAAAGEHPCRPVLPIVVNPANDGSVAVAYCASASFGEISSAEKPTTAATKVGQRCDKSDEIGANMMAPQLGPRAGTHAPGGLRRLPSPHRRAGRGRLWRQAPTIWPRYVRNRTLSVVLAPHLQSISNGRPADIAFCYGATPWASHTQWCRGWCNKDANGCRPRSRSACRCGWSPPAIGVPILDLLPALALALGTPVLDAPEIGIAE